MDNTNKTIVNAADGLIGRFPQLASVSANLLAKVGEIEFNRRNGEWAYRRCAIKAVLVKDGTIAVLADGSSYSGSGGVGYFSTVALVTEEGVSSREFQYRDNYNERGDNWAYQFECLLDLLPKGRVVTVEMGRGCGPKRVEF